jgi:hypothetical protein
MSKFLFAAVFALAAASCPPAEAKVYLSVTNHTLETSFYLIATPVKLNDTGNTTVSFTLSAQNRVAITYSAECRVGTAGSDASVTILVDGTALAPTGTYTNFCNTEFYGMHSMTLSKVLATGTHKIRVIGISHAANFGYLKNSSLVVFD